MASTLLWKGPGKVYARVLESLTDSRTSDIEWTMQLSILVVVAIYSLRGDNWGIEFCSTSPHVLCVSREGLCLLSKKYPMGGGGGGILQSMCVWGHCTFGVWFVLPAVMPARLIPSWGWTQVADPLSHLWQRGSGLVASGFRCCFLQMM